MVCSFGQDTNYCDWTSCHLPKDHEAHFDPYYNGHLCENFNPKQIDFSREYLKLQTNSISKTSTNVTTKVSSYQFELDTLFNTKDCQQNGVIGLDYKRIKIHINQTNKTNNKLELIIHGKSNVSDNICDFNGKIKILNIYEITENFDYKGQATLFAEYELFEDSTQNHVGIFKGTLECSIIIDHKTKSIKLDESFAIADGYYNRTYVGTWTSYNSNLTKKCIWGDYRLPFTFDFDCGDGEMMINEKYINNGWQTFSNGSEYDFSIKKPQLKDKWWK